MKKIGATLFIGIMIFGFSMISFKKADPFHAQIETYLQEQLEIIQNTTNQMLEANSQGNIEVVKAGFYQARIPYKRAESLIEYFFTESASKLNGPNLLEANPSMPGEFLAPSGFQVLEEAVFSDEYDAHLVKSEIENLNFHIQKIKNAQKNVTYTPTNVLDALKLNLFRMMTKGMTGFDSPVIFNSVEEAKETLTGTTMLLALVRANNNTDLLQHIQSAQTYLAQVKNFDTWDRATFLVQYMNPITTAMVQYQKTAQIPFDTLFPKLINPEAQSLFDYSQWNILFFAPSDALPITAENIAIGEQLFFDKRISVNLQRNCASCHDPKKDFTDGLKTNSTLFGDKVLQRNSPTLTNSGWQPAQFYDRRVVYLEDQIHDVVVNKDEMGDNFDIVLERLNKDKSLKKAIKKTVNKKEITERDVKRFIATYIRSLNNFNTPFDQYMNGNNTAMSTDAVKGFNLFMGKAKCGTCHFMPLFNGTVPPNFEKIESEVLGVPIAKNSNLIDTDSGAYNIYNIGYQLYSFKTPTVRGSKNTAPYMHNGIYNTLDEVIDFYNHGGGAGLGIELEFQTLPPDSLLLSVQEKAQIKAFLNAL